MNFSLGSICQRLFIGKPFDQIVRLLERKGQDVDGEDIDAKAKAKAPSSSESFDPESIKTEPAGVSTKRPGWA